MFAYCNNCPVSASDPTGHFSKDTLLPAHLLGGGGMGGGAVVVVAVVGIAVAEQQISSLIAEAASNLFDAAVEATYNNTLYLANALTEYKAVARALSWGGIPYDAHHLVPHHDHRAASAQAVLKSVGFDPSIYSLNIIPIPRHLHQSLHTNAYFAHVEKLFAGKEGDPLAVYLALFQLRAEVSAYCSTGVKSW